jgi:hypothetical protein
MRVGPAHGAAGICAGRSAATPDRRTTSRVHGLTTDRMPAVQPSGRSSSGLTMSERSLAKRTVSGSWRAAMTDMPFGRVRGRWPARSPSGSGEAVGNTARRAEAGAKTQARSVTASDAEQFQGPARSQRRRERHRSGGVFCESVCRLTPNRLRADNVGSRNTGSARRGGVSEAGATLELDFPIACVRIF